MAVTACSFSQGYNLEQIQAGEAFDASITNELVRRFSDDGWVYLPAVISRGEAFALRSAVERKYLDPIVRSDEGGDHIRGVGLMRMFEYSLAFRELIVREPLIGLVESLLGNDCHVISQNALRTPTGNGIVDWHIDGELLLPLLSNLPRNGAAWNPPCFSLSVMIPLTGVDEPEYGPTQIVPRTHLSGRIPTAADSPNFEGEGPKTLFAKAGDAYLINHQVWHRGMQNLSDRTRYMAVTAYGRRFIQQRFYPFLNYAMPEHVLTGASEKLLRLLGKHQKGPFG